MIKLNELNTTTIKNYLNFIKDNIEVEIRFGTYKNSFDTDIQIPFFYNLKNYLDDKYSNIYTITYTIENYYNNPNKKSKIREIIYTDNLFNPLQNKSSKFLIKNNFKVHDIYDYNFRINVATENFIKKEYIKDIDFTSPEFIRKKERFSYKFSNFKLDLTIVQQTNSNNKRYEIELEIFKNSFDELLNILTFILQIRQNNFNIISVPEYKQLLIDYKSLTKTPFFIGAQPETLQKDQLSLLFKELYSVTDKADGERYFLFINNYGFIYLLDSNIQNILKTDLYCEFKNTLIDGELIRDENNFLHFHSFDILFYNNIDLRDNSEFLLKQRLEILNSVIQSIPKNKFYFFYIKKYIYRNVFLGSEIIMNNVHTKFYKNDGLIFTPVNEPYPKTKKWSKLLKWKPQELNTIDFFSVKQSNGKWTLYVQAPIENSKDSIQNSLTNLVPFDVNKICKCSSLTYITYETTFDDNLCDPHTKTPFQSHTVIEFNWDTTLNKFVPLRSRWDKTYNDKKQGNYVTVACSIWNNIHNPITPDQIYNMNNSSTIKDNSFFFDKFNNIYTFLQDYINNKYINKNTYLLELYTNIYKNNIYKNSQSNVINSYSINNLIKYTNNNYLNFKIDLHLSNSINLIQSIVPKPQCFTHSVIFQSKFFLQSNDTFTHFLNILNSNLTNNSTIFILYLNNDSLNSNFDFLIQNNQIIYYYNKLSQTSFSNKIKIYLHNISNENDLIDYSISKSKLHSLFLNNNFTLIKDLSLLELFSDTTLNEFDKYILPFYNLAIFNKNSNTNNIQLSLQKNIISTPINNTSTLFSIKHLKFYNIKTYFDLFDILNCINTNYLSLSFSYPDNPINSFQDISDILKNTIYKPIFIDTSHNITTSSNESSNNIIFYQYDETINTDTDTPTIKTYYFIILIDNNILSKNINTNSLLNLLSQFKLEETSSNKKQKNKEYETSPENIVTQNDTIIPETQTVITQNDTTEINLKIQIKKEFDLIKDKITVIKLKQFLKSLNLKITGTKIELLERLNKSLN